MTEHGENDELEEFGHGAVFRSFLHGAWWQLIGQPTIPALSVRLERLPVSNRFESKEAWPPIGAAAYRIVLGPLVVTVTLWLRSRDR